MKSDYSGDPIFYFELDKPEQPETGYKFWPVNVELIDAFLEVKRKERDEREKNWCGAV